MPLPSSFRKISPGERRKTLLKSLAASEEEINILNALPLFDDLSDVLVENAIGFLPLPMGIVPDFPVNGKSYHVPLATEEPSIIAALSYTGRILSRAGGLRAEAAPALTKGQVFLSCEDADCVRRVKEAQEELLREIKPGLSSMESRGGGFINWDVHYHYEVKTLETGFWVDTRDAMGANLVNTLAETLVKPLEKLTGGKKIMAILSNTGSRRIARAVFSLPLEKLSGKENDPVRHAERIVLASELARNITDRAITHNKGIMNGVSALALATGNDTRALEAAVHSHAARDGKYRGLTRYTVEDKHLKGEIELPLPLATVGGGVNFHPAYTLSLKLLGSPGASELSAVAAAVGLAQNLAALMALTGPGIQRGHMRLHARRLAYKAGARDEEISLLVDQIMQKEEYSLDKISMFLEKLRQGGGLGK